MKRIKTLSAALQKACGCRVFGRSRGPRLGRLSQPCHTVGNRVHRLRLGLVVLSLLACAFPFTPIVHAQTDVVSSFSAVLNATCSTPTTVCAGQVSPVAGTFGTTGSALDEVTGYFNSSTITVTGTYSGATINFGFSDASAGGGVNYFSVICARTDINLLEASEVLPTNQARAWNCPAWAVSHLRVWLSALGSGSVNVTMTMSTVAVDPSLVVAASITNIAGASDPCQDVSATKASTFPANITTATTTSLVPTSGTTKIYVCGFQITSFDTTTANTFQLEYGTGAACVTTQSPQTPVYTSPILAAGNAPFVMTVGFAGQSVLTPSAAGAALCLVSTVGSTPVIQALITYVQQ